MKKTPGQMASLINSPKHIKKDQYQLHRLFKKTEKKYFPSFMIWKPNQEKNTRPLSIRQPDKETAVALEAWDLPCRPLGWG